MGISGGVRMNGTTTTIPQPRLVKVCDEGPDSIEEYDVILEHPEEDLSTGQIIARMARRCKWRCQVEGCDYYLPFKVKDVHVIPFLTVRHLIKGHKMNPHEIVRAEPLLAEAVQAYYEEMGIETPVEESTTGVFTEGGDTEEVNENGNKQASKKG